MTTPEVEPASDSQQKRRTGSTNHRSPLRQLTIAATCVSGILAILVALIWMQSGLVTARNAMQAGAWQSARTAARRYLWLHPNDAETRMIAALGYSQDDSLPAEEAAKAAIAQLNRIPDTAFNAAEARTLEGRLTFLILLQPTRATALFHRAVELNPEQFDAHYLLWKLHDMTERFFDSEPYFRRAWQFVPEDQRAVRLREWYLSQFNPLSACAELDAMMGFRHPTEPASEAGALRRLSAFAEREPDSPVIAAALAQYWLRNRQRDTALKVLEQVPNTGSVSDPFYIATLAEVLLELGQLEQAKAVFSRWANPTKGYRYSRIAGMIAQLVDNDFDRAAKLYGTAVADWPGPSDWLTMHRRFRCLAVLGKTDEASIVQQQSEAVEELMGLEYHKKLKDAFRFLDSPDRLQEVVEYYKSLHREWEHREWEAVVARISS